MEIKVTFDDAVVEHWNLNEKLIKEVMALHLYKKGEVTMGAAANIIGLLKAHLISLCGIMSAWVNSLPRAAA